MKPVEYDVYLCCRHADDDGMLPEVAAGLTRLGFRVFVPVRETASDARAGRLEAIEKAPDFVLLSAPEGTSAPGGGADPRRADLAHAFKTRRNILVLADPAHGDPLASSDLPGRPRLAAWQRVTYDRTRTRESIALVAHRLGTSLEVEDRRFMRRVKRAAAAVALMLVAAVALRAVPAAVEWWNRPKAPPPLPRYVLYWTAYGQRLQNGQWTAFPVTDGTAVAGGDQIRLVFSGGSDGCAYVVVRDAQGGVSVLFPGATVRGASRVRAGTVYQAPGEGRWFAIDARAPIAALYLIGGYDPLENLEELAEEADGGLTPGARMELLSSTVAGLLDGKHAAVMRPVRTRSGREIVDALAPVPPPSVWPAAPGGPSASRTPAAQTGLLSAVVEIRLRAETTPHLRE
jgi:hypothetical protein